MLCVLIFSLLLPHFGKSFILVDLSFKRQYSVCYKTVSNVFSMPFSKAESAKPTLETKPCTFPFSNVPCTLLAYFPGFWKCRQEPEPTWMVLVSFRAGVTVPMGGLVKVAGDLLFKLIFSRASATCQGFWGTVLCCFREFSISLASCTFPLIRNRASFCKSFSRASLTPSLSRASEIPIFCRASNLCWKVAVRVGWLRRLCWIPTRDRMPPTPGLVLSLQVQKCNSK